MSDRTFVPAAVPKPGKITIEITEEAIRDAVRADSSHCVIADAINKAIPFARAEVDLQTITITLREKGFRYTWLTPEVGQDHLISFDQGGEVKPFTLTLAGKSLVKARKAALGHKSMRSLDGVVNGGAAKVAAVRGTSRPVDVKKNAIPAAVLSNRKGRVRKYGLKQAKPGVAGF